jgi:signal transduction histidine kinase/CheY-like chemotaxis protein
VVAIGAAYVASVFIPLPLRPGFLHWPYELIPVIVPAVTAGYCIRAAKRLPRSAAMWILLGIGAAAWAAGDLAFTILDAVGVEPAASLTFADWFYLAMVPLWCAALIMHPARSGHGLEKWGTSLDAAAVIVGAGGMAWAWVLVPLAQGAENLPGVIVNLAYPIGDLALLTAFFALVVRSGVNLRSSDALVGAGFALVAVADLTFARLALTDSYVTGSPVDLVFAGGFVAIAVAAVHQVRHDPSKDHAQRSAGPLTGVVGLVAIAAVGASGIISGNKILIAAAMFMGLLLTSRQTLLLLDRRHLNVALEHAKESAQQANAAKTEFLSHMSHELGTPLTAILGYAHLIEQNAGDEEMRDHARQVAAAGNHLNDIVREALDISRIEQGRLGLSLEPISLAALVGECVELIKPMAEVASVRASVATNADADTYVLADQQRLKQVLLNLLSNAVKYNRQGGAVIVGWGPAPVEKVRVTVTDTGAGIPPAALGKLFMPFERLGSGDGVKGTGLGLTVSKRLVEAMGGAIGVQSVVGEGTTFWVDIPRALRPVIPREPLPAPAGDHALEGTVLYIEDNVVNLALVEQLLRGRSVQIIPAKQGQVGLRLAVERRPDVILLDRHLPDGPAEDVLTRLRLAPETRDIPVIILSADSSDQFESLLEAGARACLTKPIDVQRLMGLLNQVLRRAATARPA